MGRFPLRTILIAAVIIMCLLAVLSWRSACTSADKARREASVAAAQASVGKTAATASDEQMQAEAANRDTEAQNREDILNAANANETAGDAGLATLRALCRRVQYHADPKCIRLRESDRANPSH